jgi:hypothetical protein
MEWVSFTGDLERKASVCFYQETLFARSPRDMQMKANEWACLSMEALLGNQEEGFERRAKGTPEEQRLSPWGHLEGYLVGWLLYREF